MSFCSLALQWGKSTIVAIKALHEAVHNQNTITIILSRTKGQAAIILQRIRANDSPTSTTDDLVVATSLAAWHAINTTPQLLPTRDPRYTYFASGTRRLL